MPQTPPPRPQTELEPISIKLWGPATWHFLHVFSFSYPVEPTGRDKEVAANLLRTVQETLPCASCREHFAKLLAETPPALDSRQAFSRWLVDAHNAVNRRIGKPIVTYEDAYKWYHKNETLCDAVPSSTQSLPTRTGGVLLCVTILLLVIIAIIAVVRYVSMNSK